MQAVQAFVRQAMGYIDEAPSEAVREELIKTLQSVTEGKVRLWVCCLRVQMSLEPHGYRVAFREAAMLPGLIADLC